MAPPRAARTFAEDPDYMLLYQTVKAMSEKPDYDAVRIKTGLASIAAVKKRLDRLLKVQDDAENAGSTTAVTALTVTTPAATTTAKKAGKGAVKKKKAAEDDGDGEKNGKVTIKSKTKKRKLADVEDGKDAKNDDDINDEISSESVKEETDE